MERIKISKMVVKHFQVTTIICITSTTITIIIIVIVIIVTIILIITFNVFILMAIF